MRGRGLATPSYSITVRPFLSDEEKDIMRRGRNAHVTHQAKNASSLDYHKATGVEALFGYLYLKEETDRISMIADIGIEIC